MEKSEHSKSFSTSIFFIVMQVITATIFTRQTPEHYGRISSFIAILLFYLTVFILPILFYIKLALKANIADYLKLKVNALKGLIWGFGISAAILAAFIFMGRIKISELTLTSVPFLPTLGLFLAALIEEITVRGFYLKLLREKMNFWHANILSSMIFALLHIKFGDFKTSVMPLIIYFFMGLWLGLLYKKIKSLWAPILVHGFFNVFTAFVG